MRKLLLILFSIVCLTAGSVDARWLVGPISAADPCVTAGCSGTYDTCWTGEYSGDTDKACQNSGASQVDGTQNGSVITTNGDVYATFNATNDYIRWVPYNVDTIDNAGYCEFNLTTPSSFTGNAFYTFPIIDGSNDIFCRVDGSGDFYMRHNDGTAEWSNSITLAVSTTYRCRCSWDTVGDDMYVACKKSGESEMNNEITSGITMTEFGTGMDYTYFGDGGGWGIVGTWTGDDYVCGTGYNKSALGDPS